MAITNFFMDPAGNDLNSGSTAAAAASYTSINGNFDGTSLFTPTDGQTTTSFVSVGDYVSLYNTADTTARCVAKVTAVGAGVNGTITIDTVLKYGTVPTVASGTRHCKKGGAWASLAITAAAANALGAGTVPQPTQVNIIAGAYPNTTTTRTIAIAGTSALPLIFSGYQAAINDQDTNLLAVAGTDIPSITWTTGSLAVSGSFVTFRNLAISGARTTGSQFGPGANTVVSNCQVVNTGAGVSAIGVGAGTQLALIACYVNVTSTTASLITATSNFQTIVASFLKGGAVGILFTAAAAVQVHGNVFDSQSGDAMQFSTGYGMIANNTVYAPTGNGITWSGASAGPSLVVSNHFENVNQASKAALNSTTGTNTSLIRAVGNSYFNCTANIAGLGDFPAFFDLGTLASSGLTNPDSDDFTPTTVLKNIGFPAHMPTLSQTNYPTPGAMQPESGAGGGTTTIFQVEA